MHVFEYQLHDRNENRVGPTVFGSRSIEGMSNLVLNKVCFVPDCMYDSFLGLENGTINDLLIVGEGAIDWEGAGDVGAIKVVLGTHVKQRHVAVL